MIVLARPSRADLDELVHQTHSFLWWYADLTTQSGDALVLIWSVGLPFLPTRADQRSAGPRAALSLALYREGRPDFFLLQDYGAANHSIDLGSGPLGDGQLGATVIRSRASSGVIELGVRLDESIPSSRRRLTGSLSLSGPEYATQEDSGAAPHLWTPRVVHGEARAELVLGQERVELHGAGYFDSNFGRTPLQSQQIARWLWGRVAFPDRTFAYYRTEGSEGRVETRIISQGAEDAGNVCSGDLRMARLQRSVFGLQAPRQVAFRAGGRTVSLELCPPVDDGPFYQRFLVHGRDQGGRTGRGVAEVVLPGRLDVPWQRPFLRMRTHVVGGPNSIWLPLFSGARRGRVGRMLGLEAR